MVPEIIFTWLKALRIPPKWLPDVSVAIGICLGFAILWVKDLPALYFVGIGALLFVTVLIVAHFYLNMKLFQKEIVLAREWLVIRCLGLITPCTWCIYDAEGLLNILTGQSVTLLSQISAILFFVWFFFFWKRYPLAAHVAKEIPHWDDPDSIFRSRLGGDVF